MLDESRLSIDARALCKCALFKELHEADRLRLAERAHRRQFRAGDHIFRFGDVGESMMTILTGTVRISRPTGARGKEMILVDLPPGEIIGEIALLDGKARSADATALTNAELLMLDRREFIPFLEEHPHLCLKLLAMVCAKLRLSDERMADIGFVDMPARLAKALLRYAPISGEHHRPFKLSLTQTELAEMIGVRREGVSRLLNDWQRNGILELKEGWIVVPNQDSLAGIANAG
jgi:CRP/FNR family transcriptional regulator, cyclic AMP receptor protein